MSKIDVIETEGKVIEVLPKTQFKVQLTNGHVILAYLGGKLRINNIRTSSENYAAMFHEEAKKSARLQESLNEYSRYDELTPEIAKEVHSLFPQTDNISLSVATESLTDTTAIKRYVIAVIGMKKRSQFSDGDKEKITKWLETRLGIDTISVIVK